LDKPTVTNTAETLLALDLGQKMGWALSQRDGTIRSGVCSLKPAARDTVAEALVRLSRWLDEIDETYGPFQRVLYEQVRGHKGTVAAHWYGAFWGAVNAWCKGKEIPTEGVAVGTIKKHATGKGNATKQGMVLAIRSLGFYPKDDNEADALALLLWGQENKGVY